MHGELLDGKYMRVHRSIYSSRSDIKSLNTLIENKITNILEPLASIAYTLGFEYYHGIIESIWKEIMKNHAHDSIGCCCSDKVHQEIVNRFVLANEKVDQLIEFYKRKITDAEDNNISLDKLSVFNLLPYHRKEVIETKITTRMKSFELYDYQRTNIPFKIISKEEIDPGIIDRQIVHYGNYDSFIQYTVQFIDTIPAMGYKTYFIIENEEHVDQMNMNEEDFENEYYKINFHSNGTIDIYDKKRNCHYENLLMLEDSSDDGDGYDYSPLENDYIITSKNSLANIEIKKMGYKKVAIIEYEMELPEDIHSRKEKVCDGKIDVHLEIELKDMSPFISIKGSVNNKVKDHRLRLFIPSHINGKMSVSDFQFGMIKRKVVDDAMKVWETEKWSERPDSIYPMLSYVAIENSHIAALTNSIREYEVVGDNYDSLALTLYRSVGVLGKENLVRRPGRPSGIKLPTPDSQLLKEISFELAITTYDKEEDLSLKAKEYLTPIVSYNKMPYNAMKLNDVDFHTPYEYSLLENHSKLTLSTLKKAESKDGLILRVFNTQKEEQHLQLNIPCDTSVSLNEENINFEIKIITNQVKSFYIENE